MSPTRDGDVSREHDPSSWRLGVDSNYEERKVRYVAAWQQTGYSGVYAKALCVGSVHVHAVHGRRITQAL